MAAAADHAMQSVREADRDRYLSVLFAPEDKRPALFALYAFNAEIAGIRDKAREAMPGEIRLQWWRDAIASGDAAGNPLAAALLEAIAGYGLPVAAFLDYLEARTFDLYDDPMPSRTDLEGYCGETAGAVIQLASLILDRDAAASGGDAAGHAGCAQAIAGLLRLLPLHAARGQCFVPRDILAAVGTTPEELVSRQAGAAAGRALEGMIALGREHFGRFERHARELPATLRPAYLPASLAGAYLARLADRCRDPLREAADISPLRRYSTLAWRAFRGW